MKLNFTHIVGAIALTVYGTNYVNSKGAAAQANQAPTAQAGVQSPNPAPVGTPVNLTAPLDHSTMLVAANNDDFIPLAGGQRFGTSRERESMALDQEYETREEIENLKFRMSLNEQGDDSRDRDIRNSVERIEANGVRIGTNERGVRHNREVLGALDEAIKDSMHLLMDVVDRTGKRQARR